MTTSAPRAPSSSHVPSAERTRRRAANIATTERVLAAAELEFATRGFDGARLSDIAGRVGLGRSSILHYFETKQALYAMVVRTAFLRMGEAVLIELDGTDPVEVRMMRAVEAFEAFLDARPTLAKLVLREVLDEDGMRRVEVLDAGELLLAQIEQALRARGSTFRPGAPVRATLLQLASNAVLRASAHPRLRSGLWGGAEKSADLVATLLLNRGVGAAVGLRVAVS